MRTLLRFASFASLAVIAFAPLARAETPELLAKATEQWDASGQDLAFTQRMVVFRKDSTVKSSELARYDPSRPDTERWRLLEINGKPATAEQRGDWEAKKNRRARNRGGLSPSAYLDLAQARLVEEDDKTARYEVGLRKDKAKFVATEQLAVVLQVDKKSAAITHISAMLREPMKIALGLAKVTDVDLDLPVAAADDGQAAGEVHPDASAKLSLSKLGEPIEYQWSDFERVDAHADAKKAGKSAD